ncbi:MAG: hypothetical protein JKY48_13860 [Flavobacteriales bacterium]|nr:hypothetical protein [Flavobacteriales bacterium]
MRKRSRKNIERRTPHSKIKVDDSDNMESFNILMVFAFFLATFYIFQSFIDIDISLLQLLQLYCLFVGLSFFISIKWYRNKFTMSFYEYILFNFLAFAPLAISALFFINEVGKGKEYVETYVVESFIHSEYNTIYTLKDKAYEEDEYLRSIGQYDNIEIKGNSKLSIYFSDGLFGLRIIEKKVLH